MAEVKVFHWADYLVFVISLVVSAVIGIYYGVLGKKNNSVGEFFMGDRKMNLLPVALSMQATFLSAIFLLGVPAEVYTFGSIYLTNLIGHVIAVPIIAHLFVPMFRRRHLMISAHEYLGNRFNDWVRLVAAVIYCLMTLLYMAIVLYAPALAFSQVTGLSLWLTLLGTGLVCTFYTGLGGMKAVIWTDAFQMVTIMTGVLALFIKGAIVSGGFEKVFRTAWQGGRIQFNAIDFWPTTRHTFWTQSIGTCVTVTTLYCGNQSMIQRYLTLPTTRHAQIGVYISISISIVLHIIIGTIGLIMFTYFVDCDPLLSRKITKRDQLVPYFMMDILSDYRGLPGVFTACVFSAALSTVSSGVNSLAAVILIDLIKPCHQRLRNSQLSESAAAIISKVIAYFFGLLTVGLGFAASALGPAILQIALSVFGMGGGPLLGVFTLGTFFPRANAWGALVGLITGLTLTCWASLGATFFPSPPVPLPLNTTGCHHVINDTLSVILTTKMSTAVATTLPSLVTVASIPVTRWNILTSGFYRLSYAWYSVLGLVTVITVGISFSLLTECAGVSRRPVIDEDLLFRWNRSSRWNGHLNLENNENKIVLNEKYTAATSQNALSAKVLPRSNKDVEFKANGCNTNEHSA